MHRLNVDVQMCNLLFNNIHLFCKYSLNAMNGTSIYRFIAKLKQILVCIQSSSIVNEAYSITRKMMLIFAKLTIRHWRIW